VVKNNASESVVIAFVKRDGTEYSAANEGIHPAAMDPDAVLVPSMTYVFGVNEGHVFHVRDLKTGELMAQHRVGLIAVENRYNHNIETCPEVHKDLRPVDDDTYRVMRKFPQWRPALIEQYSKEVNVGVGFKNTIQSLDGKTCPINLYYVTKEEFHQNRKPNFVERFTFHLDDNMQVSSSDGNLSDGNLWDASTKYEGSYLGHGFVARLAHDESIVVDHLVVESFKVQDCGRQKQGDAVKLAARATDIVIPVRGESSQSAAVDKETESSSLFMVEALPNLSILLPKVSEDFTSNYTPISRPVAEPINVVWK
jgi:hypothetical protein